MVFSLKWTWTSRARKKVSFFSLVKLMVLCLDLCGHAMLHWLVCFYKNFSLCASGKNATFEGRFLWLLFLVCAILDSISNSRVLSQQLPINILIYNVFSWYKHLSYGVAGLRVSMRLETLLSLLNSEISMSVTLPRWDSSFRRQKSCPLGIPALIPLGGDINRPYHGFQWHIFECANRLEITMFVWKPDVK